MIDNYKIAFKLSRLSHATASITAPVLRKPGTVRRVIAGQAEGPLGARRSVLANEKILPESDGDSRARWTPPGARLGDQRPVSVDALSHVADDPHVAAQLVILLVLAERLDLPAVNADVNVSDPPDFAVIPGVGVDHFDKVRVATVQPVAQARTHQRTSRVQAHDPVHPEEQVVCHYTAKVRAQ